MNDLVFVQVFLNRFDAEQAKGLLDEQNIKSLISADDCGGFRPHLTIGMGNVRLLVHPDDLSIALDTLKVLNEPVDSSISDEAPSVKESISYKKLKLTKFLGFALMGLPIFFLFFFLLFILNKSEVSREYYPDKKIKSEWNQTGDERWDSNSKTAVQS